MGTMIDYFFEEVEDFYYDELLNSHDALLRKTRSIGLAQNHGITDDVPSDECCELLANYLSNVTRRLEETRREAWDEYQELAEYLVDQYVEEFSGSPTTLSTLLIAIQEQDLLDDGADPYLIIAAMDVACKLRGMFRNAAGGDPFGRQKIEQIPFTINLEQRPNVFASEAWDAAIGDMIDQFENEL